MKNPQNIIGGELAAVREQHRVRDQMWPERRGHPSRGHEVQELLHREGHPHGRLGSSLAELVHPGRRVRRCAAHHQRSEPPEPCRWFAPYGLS